MNRKFKPNTALPDGGRTVRPFRKSLGDWTVMEYDAKIQRLGLTWYRVRNGMSGNGDREDWVAEIPSGCLSVHDYNWIKGGFGQHHGSFNDAILAQTKMALNAVDRTVERLRKELSDANDTKAALEAAIEEAE